jgi:integrase
MARAKGEIKHFSKDELLSLLEAARKGSNPLRDTNILRTSFVHGLRASEVGLIRVSDVQLSERRIFIRRLKDSKGGYHPIQDDEYKGLKLLVKRQEEMRLPYLFTSNEKVQISRIRLHNLIHSFAKIAGIENVNFHMLRHSCGVHMALNNVPTINIMHWLGHRNIANTQIYTEMAASIMNEDLFLDCWILK